MSPPRNARAAESRGIAVFVSGVAAMIAAATLAAAQSWWSCWAFLLAFGLLASITVGAGVVAVRAWGIEYWGWKPFPTHAERQERKRARELEESRAAQTLREHMDALMRGLYDAERVLSQEIREKHLYGFAVGGTACKRLRSRVAAHLSSESLAALDDACRLIEDYNTRKRERLDSAATDELVKDPVWRQLSTDELEAREPVLEAITRARSALQAQQG